MPLIVDTFNVLHQTGVLPPALAGVDVIGLIELISRSRFRRQRIRLVCDGTSTLDDEDAHSAGHVTIEFSGKGRTADDVIAHHVKRSSAPRQLTIVSSDREVQKSARRRKCAVISSPEFLRQLANDFEKDERTRAKATPQRPQEFLRPLSERATAKWMRELGVHDKDAKLSDDEKEALDRAVDKLLGQRSARNEKLEKGDETPKLKRSEARAQRALQRDGDKLKKDRRDDGPPLPLELLAEAERLWKRAQTHRDSQE